MDPLDPDASLMVAFQQGDAAAFEQLVDKFHRPIVNFIYRIVNHRAEAEELAQEVFVRVYRARATYEPNARFAPWLYKIALNLSIKSAGKARRSPIRQVVERGESPGSGTIPRDPAPDVEERMIADELATVVREAIRTLPEKEKIAVLLRRYEDMSYREISEVMNCTEAAVKTYIHRGKLRVRTRLLPYLGRGAFRR